jgi:P27 family predicted phage terminase small subunit
LLPETVVELPSASGVPEPPAELVTSARAHLCSFRTVPGDDDDGDGLTSPDAARWRPPNPARCAICEADIAVAVWREMWTQGAGWLSVQRDRRILERLCKGYVEESHLRSAVDEDGPFVKGQRGGLVAHPAVSMLRVLEQQLTKWEGLCGFNPSDGGRLGVKVTKQKGTSALEDLIRKRAESRERRPAERPARPTRAKGSA